MNYRLVFDGELTGEVQKDECLEQLAELFGKDTESIEAQLFRGKPIVVKTTSDQQVVDRFVDAFKKAGAILHIGVPGEDISNMVPTPAPVSAKKESETEKSPDMEVTRLRPKMSRSDTLQGGSSYDLSEDDRTRQRPTVPDKDDRKS